MFMRFSSALVASVLSVVTIGSAWAYCDSPLGCLPSMPSYGYQPQMPNYGYQPQYLPPRYTMPDYQPRRDVPPSQPPQWEHAEPDLPFAVYS